VRVNPLPHPYPRGGGVLLISVVVTGLEGGVFSLEVGFFCKLLYEGNHLERGVLSRGGIYKDEGFMLYE